MELILIFALVLSLSICVGLNPYLSLLTLIIVAKSGIQSAIPIALHFVTQDMFIVMISILAVIHFFVDMTPGLDTAWDMFHTVIRVPLAALLSVLLLTGHGETWQMVAFFIGLIIGLIMHFAKSSMRAYLNGKSHAAYNWFASMGETILVVLVLAVTLNFPIYSFLLSLPIIIIGVWCIKLHWRDFHHLAIYIITWLQKRKGWREDDTFFD